jgi:uncharacterized SAM-binding protein YcdF (DUF218 family)
MSGVVARCDRPPDWGGPISNLAFLSARLLYNNPLIMTAEFSPPTATTSRQRSRSGRRFVTFCLLIAVMSALIWFNREALLLHAAEQWIVYDPIHPADAVAVLGGGIETRPFAAAEYYRKGLSHKILIADVKYGNAGTLLALPSHTAINRAVLIKLGVLAADIESFGTELSNTYEEAIALREWAVRTHAKSIIVPTEIFSSRRVRWMLMHALAGTGTDAQIHALDHPRYNHADWWKNDQGIIDFQNELIKYIYYRVHY